MEATKKEERERSKWDLCPPCESDLGTKRRKVLFLGFLKRVHMGEEDIVLAHTLPLL